MTFGMQIRRWYGGASPTQRGRVIVTVALAAIGVLASLMTVGGSTGPDAVAAGTATGGLGGTTVAPGTSLGDASGTTGVPAGGSGVATGAVGGAGLPGGSVAPTAIPGGASTDGSVPVGDGQGAPVVLTASDRGVSEEVIRIGFLPANLGGLGASGYALDIRTDVAEYVRALVDSVNAGGGVAGRRLEAVVRPTDPTSQGDQAAACRAMVDDAAVFGVVDVGSLSDTPAFECLAVQNQTPYVHNTIWDTEWLARSGGMEVGYPAAIDRVAATWARDLQAIGWFGDDAVVGILGENCMATSPVIDRVLEPTFAAIPGVQRVVVVKSDCSPEGVVAQPGSFVPQFRAAGVTHVVLATSFVSAAVFQSAAESQVFRPRYTVSDWWQLTSDSSAANFNPNQFDGAIGISSLGLMLPNSGKAPYPGGERCEQVALDAGLEPLVYDGRNQELWAMCDNFFLLVDGLRGAGPNPTRASWAQAVQQLGEHPSVLYGPSAFGPGKVTGSDQVHTLEWERECRCFRSISDFRPAAR
jgi:ABC-type branched-subunit amino acid transport system substrate-binding protein